MVDESENVFFLGDDKPYIVQPRPARKKQQPNPSKSKQKGKTQQNVEFHKEEREKENPSQSKRGQKGKMRKIKEKYKDQDEEERKLRMEILKSGGESKVQKKKRVAEMEVAAKKAAGKKFEPRVKDVDADEAEEPATADVEMLDSLTGIPHEEDELLFAVPVIAPYQTLHNYKYVLLWLNLIVKKLNFILLNRFKVKLTPGSGRRGKAAKMALQIFQKDKACTQREKDLMKNVREDLIARNIPGKVKLSAPHLQKAYKW